VARCDCDMHDGADEDALAEARLNARIERGEVVACERCGDLVDADTTVCGPTGFQRCRECCEEALEDARQRSAEWARDARRGL
jgi:hypothetical protein